MWNDNSYYGNGNPWTEETNEVAPTYENDMMNRGGRGYGNWNNGDSYGRGSRRGMGRNSYGRCCSSRFGNSGDRGFPGYMHPWFNEDDSFDTQNPWNYHENGWGYSQNPWTYDDGQWHYDGEVLEDEYYGPGWMHRTEPRMMPQEEATPEVEEEGVIYLVPRMNG